MSHFYRVPAGIVLGLVLLAPVGAFAQAALVAPAAAKVQLTAEELVVLNFERSLLQGRVDGDPSVAKAGFADENLYMHSTGMYETKEGYMKTVVSRPWAAWTQAAEEVHLYGDGAVTHSLLSVLLDDSRTETVRTTGVYVKQAGKWRQVAWQSSQGNYVPSSGTLER
jgi:hypothetical protein